jgi:hypothetical protein
MKLGCAVYSRYSSDRLSKSSIADQQRKFREYAGASAIAAGPARTDVTAHVEVSSLPSGPDIEIDQSFAGNTPPTIKWRELKFNLEGRVCRFNGSVR